MSMEEIRARLARNILCLRRRHGLSRRQMADILGIGEGSLKRVEAGELPRSFNATVLCRLGDHFQVSTDALLYEDMEEA